MVKQRYVQLRYYVRTVNSAALLVKVLQMISHLQQDFGDSGQIVSGHAIVGEQVAQVALSSRHGKQVGPCRLAM